MRRYKERQQQFYQNKLFRENTKKFYQLLNKQQDATSEPPSQPAVETFWRSILEDNVKHNKALWIKDEEKANQRVTPQAWTELTSTDMLRIVKRAQNWKYPGPDKLQNFWLKSFNALHQHLTRAMNKVLQDPRSNPEWMTTGVTFLLYKSKDPTDPKNYRPITCLPTMYKLLTAAVSEKVYDQPLADKQHPPRLTEGVQEGSQRM